MKTKTYDVQIEAIVTKTIRVGAADESEACEMAHELFNSDQMDVKHEQNTLDVSEVSNEDRYEKPAWVKGDKPHDRHALSNKLITNALKRGDISRPQPAGFLVQPVIDDEEI